MSISLPENLPVFDLSTATETGALTNFDWPDAIHQAIPVSIGSPQADQKSWEIRQSLEGASGISELIESGKAAYAVEARCLHTAWCELFIGTQNSSAVKVSVPIPSTRGDIFLCPGILTTEECELQTDDLHEIKRPANGASISIPAGYWLVLGRPIPVQASEKESMVYFEEDENMPEKQMKITAQKQVDDVRFQVLLSTDEYRRLQNDKMFHWGCQLSAFSMLPYTKEYDIEDKLDGTPSVNGSTIGQRLADGLHAAGIPLWDNKDDWDPAWALTASGLLKIPDMQYILDDGDDDNVS